MDGFKGTDLGPGRGKEPLFLGRLTIYIHFPVIMFRIFERRLLLLLFFFFFFFRAAPMGHGSSQARGRIAVAGASPSNAISEQCL